MTGRQILLLCENDLSCDPMMIPLRLGALPPIGVRSPTARGKNCLRETSKKDRCQRLMAYLYIYNVRELAAGLAYNECKVGGCQLLIIGKVAYIYVLYSITIIFTHFCVICSRTILG